MIIIRTGGMYIYRIYMIAILLAVIFCPPQSYAAAEETNDGGDEKPIYETLTSPEETPMGSTSNTPVYEVLEEGQPRSRDTADNRIYYQLLLGRTFFSASKVSARRTQFWGPSVSASARLDTESGFTASLRSTRWFDEHDYFGVSFEAGIVSARADDEAGSSASATLITFPIDLLFRGKLFESDRRPEGVLTPYAGLGLILYVGNLDVKVAPEFTYSVGGSIAGISFPDLRAGIQWNFGKGSSLALEWRYISMSLSYDNEGYAIFSEEKADMDLEGNMLYLGISGPLR